MHCAPENAVDKLVRCDPAFMCVWRDLEVRQADSVPAARAGQLILSPSLLRGMAMKPPFVIL